MHLTPILASLIILPTTALTWSIAFYTGGNCNGDQTFNNAIHTGSGKSPSSCIAAGAPTLDAVCSWYTNNGAQKQDCTAPMNPQPKSFMFAQTGKCDVSWYGCASPNWPTWAQPKANECFKVKDIQGKTGSEISFRCFDV